MRKPFIIHLKGQPIQKRRPCVNYNRKTVYSTQTGAIKKVQLQILEKRPARFKLLNQCRISFFFVMGRTRKLLQLYNPIDFSYHIGTPDIDNLVKFYLDAMSGIIYVDDRTVQLGPCIKVWGSDPGVFIKIEELEEIMPQSVLNDFHPRLGSALFGVKFDEFLENQKVSPSDSQNPPDSTDQQSP